MTLGSCPLQNGKSRPVSYYAQLKDRRPKAIRIFGLQANGKEMLTKLLYGSFLCLS